MIFEKDTQMTNKIQPLSDDPAVNLRRKKAKAYCDDIREQRRTWNREWIANNRERYNEAKHLYRLRLKIRILSLYASPVRCQICGFDKIDGLVLDHIHDNGAAHRKESGLSARGGENGTRIYEYVNKVGKIDGLQVLCANCNLIKEVRRHRRNTFKDPDILATVEAMYEQDHTTEQLVA
jgi:5-methylcytosine-specific restriction endonuclease McrA